MHNDCGILEELWQDNKMDTDNCKLPPEQNEDDDDDVDNLMDIQIPSGMIVQDDGDSSEILLERKRPAVVAQKPDKDLQIDDRAILDCWNITVASHDPPEAVMDVRPSTGNKYQWEAKDLATPYSTNERRNTDLLKNWQPKALPLPPWAVDPFPTNN